MYGRAFDVYRRGTFTRWAIFLSPDSFCTGSHAVCKPGYQRV